MRELPGKVKRWFKAAWGGADILVGPNPRVWGIPAPPSGFDST